MVEDIYGKLESTLFVRSTYTTMLDDFSVKVGQGGNAREKYIDKYGIGEQNL